MTIWAWLTIPGVTAMDNSNPCICGTSDSLTARGGSAIRLELISQPLAAGTIIKILSQSAPSARRMQRGDVANGR